MGLLYLFIAVLVHELGHYTVARLRGIPVETVCIFFNPGFSILKFKCAGTTWCIGWLPLGGYTSVKHFHSLRGRPKLEIAIAGIVFNFLFAFLCLLYSLPGQLTGINLALAGISLLPWSPYDGAYLFKQ